MGDLRARRIEFRPARARRREWAGDGAVRYGSEIVFDGLVPTPPPLSGMSSMLLTYGVTNAGEAAKELLMETVRDVPGEDPPVLLRPQVEEGNAANLLVDLSEDADPLVVGSRDHGGFAGLLLGPVGQHVAAHAGCTVAVVR